jgi:CubicO group peptidase (beta-lactamase class C family)
VIAWAIERASGAPLAEVLSDRIWSRLGAERDAFFTVDGAGTALADGGFNATLRDYARFGMMMLNGGMVGDAQVVPAAWVEACRNGDPTRFHAPYSDGLPDGAYKNQWWIMNSDRGDIMARGVFGQLIYIDFETDFMVVILATWPDYLIENFKLEGYRMLTALRDALATG